ncbi:MAG: hypothetical protein ABF335_11530 [Alphaproteobacteria bacterium]
MHNRTIQAFNTAVHSPNKIHDDETAAKFGFTGGLVPGVEVYAYMAYWPVNVWGEDFFHGGRMQGRFFKPVYDGENATIVANAASDTELALEVNTAGASPAAVGVASLGNAHAVPQLATAPRGSVEGRPDASPASLPICKVLGTIHETFNAEESRWYLDAVRDQQPLFSKARWAHPGYLLRRANFALALDVQLGPWIHVESDVSFYSPLKDGEPFETRAVVTDNRDHKGHLMVDLDVVILSGDRPVMGGMHRAIYEPRQVRETNVA